jgi:hypothetical protein
MEMEMELELEVEGCSGVVEESEREDDGGDVGYGGVIVNDGARRVLGEVVCAGIEVCGTNDSSN